MSYTRANKTCQGKTCQGKLGRLCGTLGQGKLVQLYTRAIKTCQGKLLEKKLVHRTHEQGKLPRNLSRKTWSSVRVFKHCLRTATIFLIASAFLPHTAYWPLSYNQSMQYSITINWNFADISLLL